jgi:CheY-like chemotaxis protein
MIESKQLSPKPIVLVVEDNHVVRLIAITNLKRYADVDIRLASNGLEALRQIEQNDFDLILMDIRMPLMDGLEATRTIRAIESRRGKHTPIVAVTASETQEECINAGMDDYVVKPADYRRIIAKWLPTARSNSA